MPPEPISDPTAVVDLSAIRARAEAAHCCCESCQRYGQCPPGVHPDVHHGVFADEQERSATTVARP